MQNLISWKKKKIGSRKPLLLKGARQIGKTYVLEQFGKEEFPRFHRFNFEKQKDLAKIFEKDLSSDRLIKELSFFQKTTIDIENDLVIFDEIQACSSALTSLKYFNEEMPILSLCAAGSLLGVYLTPVSFPVGNVEIMDMYPLSFEEFLIALGEEQACEMLQDNNLDSFLSEYVHNRFWELLKHYFAVGGLPEAIKDYLKHRDQPFEAMKAVRFRQEQLIAMYNADMAKHSGKVNAMHIDHVLKSVPQQMGATRDGSVAKYKFSGVVPGVSRYTRLVAPIDWLIAADLIIKVPIVKTVRQPLFSFTKESMFKLYLFDVGLLGAISNLSPKILLDYDFGTYKGFIAENYVLQEFFAKGLTKVYNWQDGRHEVEFLFESDGDILPIEVKSGWITKAKSLNQFVEKYHPPYRTIFSAKPLNIDHENQVHKYPLYLAGDFAKKQS